MVFGVSRLKQLPGHYMKRISLFLVTNLAVLLVLSVTLPLLGIEPFLQQRGLSLGPLLAFAAVLGMGGSLISLAISKWMAIRIVGANVVEVPSNATERWLVETVRRQAQAADIGTPEVAIYETTQVNVFATGMNRNKALVAVSTGLLATMTEREAEAVLAHEVSHIANGDMVTLALIQGVVNTFVIVLARVIGHLVIASYSRRNAVKVPHSSSRTSRPNWCSVYSHQSSSWHSLVNEKSAPIVVALDWLAATK